MKGLGLLGASKSKGLLGSGGSSSSKGISKGLLGSSRKGLLGAGGPGTLTKTFIYRFPIVLLIRDCFQSGNRQSLVGGFSSKTRPKGLVLSIDLGIKALRDAILHAKVKQKNKQHHAQAQKNMQLLHSIGKRDTLFTKYIYK